MRWLAYAAIIPVLIVSHVSPTCAQPPLSATRLTPLLVQGSRDPSTRQIDEWAVRQEVFGLAASPDKRYVAIASSYSKRGEVTGSPQSDSVSGRVLIWDRHAKRVSLTIDQSEAGQLNGASCVAYSPDGKFVATGSAGGGLMTWDAKTGALLRRFSQVYAEQRHATESARVGQIAQPGQTIGVLISPDSSRVISLGGDGSIRVWRTSDGAMERVLHGDEYPAAVFSKDGKSLFVSFGAVIDKLEWPSCRVVRHLAGHDGTVISLSRAPSTSDILSVSADGTVKRWDTQRGIERWTHGKLSEGAVSRNGHIIAYSLGDAVIRLADGRTGKPRGELRGFRSHLLTCGQIGPFRSIAISPNGRYVAASTFTTGHMIVGLAWSTAQANIYLWDTSSKKLLKYWSSKNVIAVAFNRIGNRVLEFPYNDRAIPQIIRIRAVPDGRVVLSQRIVDEEICRNADWPAVSDFDSAGRFTFAAFVTGKAPHDTKLVTIDEQSRVRSSWTVGNQFGENSRIFAATATGPGAVNLTDREFGYCRISAHRYVRLSNLKGPIYHGYVAISLDGKSIAGVSLNDGLGSVWKAAGVVRPIELALPTDLNVNDSPNEFAQDPSRLMFNNDGSRLFAVTNDGVFVWELVGANP